jgi:thioredoxin-like negative regulator of GroEL
MTPALLVLTDFFQDATVLLLKSLQLELGAAIRVLKVDAASHPAIVRAFDSHGLPAFVLLRDGAGLYRQQGLPEGTPMVALLLSKLPEATLPAS